MLDLYDDPNIDGRAGHRARRAIIDCNWLQIHENAHGPGPHRVSARDHDRHAARLLRRDGHRPGHAVGAERERDALHRRAAAWATSCGCACIDTFMPNSGLDPARRRAGRPKQNISQRPSRRRGSCRSTTTTRKRLYLLLQRQAQSAAAAAAQARLRSGQRPPVRRAPAPPRATTR